jgi:hypothetical protein
MAVREVDDPVGFLGGPGQPVEVVQISPPRLGTGALQPGLRGLGSGLTQRTFFRYFSDKKEVPFAGSASFESALAEGLRGARLGSAHDHFDARAEAVRVRWTIMSSSAELEERELQKMVRVADQAAEILQDGGEWPADARFAADLGVLGLRTAFARWVKGSGGTLSKTVEGTLDDLRSLVSFPAV